VSEKELNTQPLVIPRHIIELSWQLMFTRDWPISMMTDLATVKEAFHKAVEKAELDAKPETADADGAGS